MIVVITDNQRCPEHQNPKSNPHVQRMSAPHFLQLLGLLDATVLATWFCHPSEKGTREPGGKSADKIWTKCDKITWNSASKMVLQFCKHLRWVFFTPPKKTPVKFTSPTPTSREECKCKILHSMNTSWTRHERPMNCDWNQGGISPGTPKDMGPTPENGKRDPYHSHISRDSYWGSLEIPPSEPNI